MNFWDTPAGVAALSAARARLRVSDYLALGFESGDQVVEAELRVAAKRAESLQELLAAQEARPSIDDVVRASGTAQHVGAVPQLEAERAVAVTLVLAADAVE